jgi:hypothetical protein
MRPHACIQGAWAQGINVSFKGARSIGANCISWGDRIGTCCQRMHVRTEKLKGLALVLVFMHRQGPADFP